MSRRELVHILCGLLLAAALILVPALPTPAAAAAAGAAPARAWTGEGLLDAFWGLFARLWAKEGPDMDQNGAPQAGALPAGGLEKAGSSMDPDGAPQNGAAGSGVSDQAGPNMDPDGES